MAPLANFVTAPAALARRLHQIGVVETSSDGQRLQGDLRPGQRLVSRDGGLWRWDGFRRVPGAPAGRRPSGWTSATASPPVERELSGAEAEAAMHRNLLDEAQRQTRERAEGDRAARQAAREAMDELANARAQEAEKALAAAAVVSRRAAHEEAAQRLRLDLAETETEIETCRAELAKLPDPALAREAAQAMRGTLSERRAVQQAQQGEHDRLLREAETRTQRLAAIGVEFGSWSQRADAAARQRQTLETRRNELLAEIEALVKRPAEIAHEREQLAETIERSTIKRNQTADELAAGETSLAEADKVARAAESAGRRSARGRACAAEGQRDQAVLARDNVVQAIAEKLQIKPEETLAAADIDADEELPDMASATARLERLVRERDNMGPVNLVAEAEAQEVEEKLTSLKREREDLTGAIARLRQGITALNREGRERLLAAFAKVNEHFSQLFVRLFGGGRAHLKLDQGDERGSARGRASRSWRARPARNCSRCRCCRAASRR